MGIRNIDSAGQAKRLRAEAEAAARKKLLKSSAPSSYLGYDKRNAARRDNRGSN